jgi:hypothetical protein
MMILIFIGTSSLFIGGFKVAGRCVSLDAVTSIAAFTAQQSL